ncbi:MAG: AAA family ATPase [Pseudomonadota bacterium]
MNKINIIGGCPGSGKTTLSAQLAERSEVGVHIVTDQFYHFLSHRLDPSTPESKSQNTSVVRAFLRTAESFAADGYQVYVDGVIGPWWLETIKAVLPRFNYAIMTADLEIVLERTRQRSLTAQASANSGLVRVMHAQFLQIQGHNNRTLDTSGKTPNVVVDEFLARQALGDFSC